MCTQSRTTLCHPWTVAHQAHLSTEYSRQEYWNIPFPIPGNLPNSGTEPVSLESLALAGGFFSTEPPGKPKEVLGKIYSIASVRVTAMSHGKGHGHREGKDARIVKADFYPHQGGKQWREELSKRNPNCQKEV